MIRRVDYFKYHRLLSQGILDDELLEKMIYDLGEEIEKIARLTDLRHNPEWGKICDSCGDVMAFVDVPGDYGDWVCSCCGAKDNWWGYLESQEWRYTDGASGLVKAYHAVLSAKDNTRRALFEKVLQLYHMSGALAPWLIEGGCQTLDEFSA